MTSPTDAPRLAQDQKTPQAATGLALGRRVDNAQRLGRQGPLQGDGLLPRGAQPDIDLFGAAQGTGMALFW